MNDSKLNFLKLYTYQVQTASDGYKTKKLNLLTIIAWHLLVSKIHDCDSTIVDNIVYSFCLRLHEVITSNII